ncbi:MAG: hypothetical protein GQ574_19415 [Crocinitomix sp.]|nr:hypothetical protein [Crocinitomix sp.]
MKSILLALILLFNFSIFAQIDCIPFSDYSDDYVNEVGWNDVDYPPGTTFMEEGALKIVKAEGETNYLSTGSDEFTFMGNVDIDVSELDCPHKTLTFSMVAVGSSWVDVDGEVVGDMAEPFPLSYSGDGWICEYDGEISLTITGDFDLVNIYGSTNILSDCCLECVDGPEENCLNFGDYTTPFGDTVGWDDETYPSGSVFMETGDIKLIKPDGETNYLSVDDESFFFVGNVTIDVASFDCLNRVLTFDIVPDPSNGISVDGNIISDEFEDWPADYDGDDFTYNLVDQTVTISGFFNQVMLFGSTNILSNVCVECDSAAFDTNCIPFNDYGDDYVNEVGWNDDDYPAGSVFMENGDLKLVKPEGETNYLSVTEEGMFFVGNIDIDVADSDCDEKVLTFTLIPDISNALSVDGEIVSDEFEAWPSTYDGDGFTFEMDDDGNCTITGNFDIVSLFGSTNILSYVCLFGLCRY